LLAALLPQLLFTFGFTVTKDVQTNTADVKAGVDDGGARNQVKKSAE
jgi:hypothetical protein